MAGQRKTQQSQDISGKGVGVFVSVIGTHVRPSSNNLNPHTPVLNQVPLRVPTRVIIIIMLSPE